MCVCVRLSPWVFLSVYLAYLSSSLGVCVGDYMCSNDLKGLIRPDTFSHNIFKKEVDQKLS